MNYLLARKRCSSSLRGKQSEANSAASSDQKLREAKSAPYQSPEYRILLETKGSFMRKSDPGIADTSKTICRILFEITQIISKNSLFQDDFFDETCEMIQNRNEAKIIQDIAQLIVLSAQSLAIRGAKRLNLDRKCQRRLEQFYCSNQISSATRLCCWIQASCIH